MLIDIIRLIVYTELIMKPESIGSVYVEEIRGRMSRDTQLREFLGTRNPLADMIGEAMMRMGKDSLFEKIKERVESEEVAPDSPIIQKLIRFLSGNEPTPASANRDFTALIKGEPTNVARSEQLAEKSVLDDLERRALQARQWIMENCPYYTEEEQKVFLGDGVYPYGWTYRDDQISIDADDEDRQEPNIHEATWFLNIHEFNTERGFEIHVMQFFDGTYELEIEFLPSTDTPILDSRYSSARQPLENLTPQEAVIMNEVLEGFLERKVRTS